MSSVTGGTPPPAESAIQPPPESLKDGIQDSSTSPNDIPPKDLSSLKDTQAVTAKADIEDDNKKEELIHPDPKIPPMPPMPPMPVMYNYSPHSAHGPGPHVFEPSKEVKRGSKAEVKQLFEGPPKCKCCRNWVEQPPSGSTKELITKAKWGEYAVVVRKTAHGGDKSWKLDSVSINSKWVLEVLRKHLAKYPGLALEGEEFLLDPPFAPLLHFWPEIVHSGEDTRDPADSEHFALYKKVIEPELEGFIKTINECAKHGKIEFADLWTVFKPNSLIYWEENGQSNVGRLKEAVLNRSMAGAWYHITAEQVDFDGLQFGYKKVVRIIDHYKGYRSIFDMTMPLEMKEDQDAVTARLIERGRKFQDLRGYHFKAYEGRGSVNSASKSKTPTASRKKISGRVVVDATTFYSPDGKGGTLALTSLKEPSSIKNAPRKSTAHPQHDAYDPYRHSHHMSAWSTPDSQMHPGGMSAFMPAQRPHTRPGDALDSYKPLESPPLSDEELLLCVPTVPAFLLKEKIWAMLNVDEITDIVWETIFERLVLPFQVKDLLLAFVQSKTKGGSAFDDFVGGKGKGIIMLLSGPPGVGKTLTAEGIAEKLQVPLYTLSAGELGSVAGNVETSLTSAMNKCARWNAVLLLDECDVFLEKRELNSLKRNELVSIFLRLVEYYEGIMLLTTNRISTIDPAFNSRMDVAIAYKELSAEHRLQVWKNFIAKLQDSGEETDKDIVEGDGLEKLAVHHLNGRQIKSVVKTAQLLAKSKEEPLGFKHLDTIVELNKLRHEGLDGH